MMCGPASAHVHASVALGELNPGTMMNQNQLIRLIQSMLRNSRGRQRKLMIAAAVLLVAYVLLHPVIERQFGVKLPSLNRSQQHSQGSWNGGHGGTATVASPGEQAILDAFDGRKSNLIVQFTAEVKKNLADDNIEPRHQKMILRLPSGHTVMLAHNIDLAQRVPARQGDQLEIKGEYEYSEQGGVVHWTHHDPAGRHVDGWIKHDEVKYN